MGMKISFGDSELVTPALKEIESGYGDTKTVEVKLAITAGYGTATLTLDDSEKLGNFLLAKVGEGRGKQIAIAEGIQL